MIESLQAFADDYHARRVPPPHILLVGKDDQKSLTVARQFAAELEAGYSIYESSNLLVQGTCPPR